MSERAGGQHFLFYLSGGLVTRSEEAAVLRLWKSWSVGRTRSNATYSDFFFDVVQMERELRDINVYEVLDLLINADQIEPAV